MDASPFINSATAETSIQDWLHAFRLLRDERGVFSHWRDLVTTYGVRGRNAHDARLVAAMQRHGVSDLLTFNGPDFTRFASINVHSPTDVLAGQIPS